MVNVRTEVMLPGQRRQARADRMVTGATGQGQIKGVRVEPVDDDMRRLLKHPRAGGFRAEGDIEWPDDTFTFRRLREGSIRLSEQKQE
jgi:hypothetical protein